MVKFWRNFGFFGKTRIFAPEKPRGGVVKNWLIVMVNKLIFATKADGSVKVFESLDVAAEQTGVTKSTICRALKGERKTAAGYSWRYVPRIFVLKMVNGAYVVSVINNGGELVEMGTGEAVNMAKIDSRKEVTHCMYTESKVMEIRSDEWNF